MFIEPITCGIILVLCSFLAYSVKTPKSTISATALGAVLSIILLLMIIIVFIRDHQVGLFELTRFIK